MKVFNHTKFNLNQVNNTYEDWNKALLSSVEKRFTDIQCEILLPLSSGHDSGLISCISKFT